MFDLKVLARLLDGAVSGSQVLAPGPGHGRRDRSLSVRLSPTAPDGFLAFSFAGDDWRACRDYVKACLGVSRENATRGASEARRQATEPRREDDRHNVSKARDLASAASYVAEMRPIRGAPGELYLREVRRIGTDTIAVVLERTDAIGWHPLVYFNQPGHPLHGRRLGCIVAVMTDPITAGPTGAISRTYVDDDLRKVDKAKTLGSPTGIVRLTSDEDMLSGLHLAEGLETALTAMAVGLRPMWATGSTEMMKKFPVLPGVDCLTIVADHDANGAGERAACEVEDAWRCAGRETRIFMADRPGDLNDVLREVSR